MKKIILALFAGTIVLAVVATASAQMDHSMHQHGHDHGSHGKHEMKMPQGMSMKTLMIDEYKVVFEIWEMPAYKKMMIDMNMDPMSTAPGTTHHIAVTVWKGKLKIDNARVKVKVVAPNGEPQTLMMPYNKDMMYQHVGHFNMASKGKYQMMTLFKVGDKNHKGGFWHEM